jgi:4'-phosphopantetheinyl transferase
MLITHSQVHVWQASLDRSPYAIEQLAPLLAADEQQRAARFRFEKDRRKFIVARGLLRSILARYLDLPPDEIQFAYSQRGKPELANGYARGKLEFNVSHSHEMALYGIALDRPIGVDLEYVRPIDAVALSQRFFSPSEAATIASLTGADQHRCFFRGWTQKEAYLKATGDGLGGLESVEVAIVEPMGLVKIDGDRQRAAEWCAQEIRVNADCDTDYIAALVTKGMQPEIHYSSI